MIDVSIRMLVCLFEVGQMRALLDTHESEIRVFICYTSQAEHHSMSRIFNSIESVFWAS